MLPHSLALELSVLNTPVTDTCSQNTSAIERFFYFYLAVGVIPPVAVQKPLVFPKWGHKRQDNWAWLRDDRREDPKVIEYLKEVHHV